MALIRSSSIFYIPEEILLCNSLTVSMGPNNPQKVSIKFTYRKEREHVHKTIISLNLVKEIPETCKGERGKYSNKNPRDG